jgi:hypothetical protein
MISRLAFLGIAMCLIFSAAAPVVAAPWGSGGGTIVTVDGSTVTITVHIDLCCVHDANERDVWTPLVLAEIKAAQDIWNQALANLPAKGCYNIKVVFDAHLLNKGDPWDPGYHQIDLYFSTKGGNYSDDFWASSNTSDDDTVYNISTTGKFYESYINPQVWAHELGHLMGLGDDYVKGNDVRAGYCLFGRFATLMCDPTGTIDQQLADRLADILNSDGLLPQCWKGTMRISTNHANLYSDSWTADIKVVVSEKGVVSGGGTARRTSDVKSKRPMTCPSMQEETLSVTGEGDRQSLRLKFRAPAYSPPGSCDWTAVSIVLAGSPQRINTIPLVGPSRAEANLKVSEGSGTILGSIDVTLDEAPQTPRRRTPPSGGSGDGFSVGR